MAQADGSTRWIDAIAALLRRADHLAEHGVSVQNLDVLAMWPPVANRAELFTLAGASAWWIHAHAGTPATSAVADAVWDAAHWWT